MRQFETFTTIAMSGFGICNCRDNPNCAESQISNLRYVSFVGGRYVSDAVSNLGQGLFR